ncbi:Ecm15p CYBJADRAFT_165946 [Cyberlindnera jadinii NRRL Y-1542]|nr:hypothetical protein CYBJADRAFT_165946 [Cyberlindnera jadinii NRRL Y-1542]ODV75190.1 hypothetical protein CYBJADRAFT_165946 [Cyberlindnera jadinii NRRL Y-1542]
MSTFQRKPINIHCLADLCLVPIGTATPSVSDEVAKIELVIKNSGLKHTLHSAGTTIEGEWDDVMNLIGQLHQTLHDQGILRIQSDIRVGTRTDKAQTAKDKVDIVNLKMKQFEQQ